MNIFSSRAESSISKYELELAYLRDAKSKINRNSGIVYNPFSELKGMTIGREVLSAKQSGVKGSVGGSGEKQIEIDKRLISDRENTLKIKLQEAKNIKKREIEIRKSKSLVLPSVALLGYTNSGKTAIMNLFTDTQLSSKDRLFETLNTSIKK